MSKKNDESQTKPNRLLQEKSPYLQQHAHNPVNWFPWGEEPFELARSTNKPIFLSIGYSTCHWCHVMERESFESKTVAGLLNEHFISVKVDREERPDVDQLYMTATQAMTGSGGWPMSVFLFPDKKPFYAGTYFPPHSRGGLPGFSDLLQAISQTWRDKRSSLHESADSIVTFLHGMNELPRSDELTTDWSESCYQNLANSYDHTFHGFGTRTKFPRPSCFSFLLSYHRRTQREQSMGMVINTLKAMGMGGLHDHIGGGFHRYSVDQQWQLPHFEKMLYDQAQLITTYTQAYRLTGDRFFAQVARNAVDYVLRDLHHEQGGFFSAEDADSTDPYDEDRAGEGAFYLWTEQEIREILTDTDAKLFLSCYGIERKGNVIEDATGEFHNRNIPFLVSPIEALAKTHRLSDDELHKKLQAARQELFKRREERNRPHRDEKIITAWNGLMISALCHADMIFDTDTYLEEAKRGVHFLLSSLTFNGLLRRRWCDGEASFDAVLEDYAFVVQGLLDLYSRCHDLAYLKASIELSEKQIDLFQDPRGGFFTASSTTDLPVRVKENFDGAEPSGNSVSVGNFIRLGRLLGKTEWLELAEGTIKHFGKQLHEQSSAMPLMLAYMEKLSTPTVQLTIVGKRESTETKTWLARIDNYSIPELQVLLADGQDNQQYLSRHHPAMKELTPVPGEVKALVCIDTTCHPPCSTLNAFDQLLQELASAPQKVL